MFPYKKVTMKCPHYETARANNVEKMSAAESKVLHLKASPVKEFFPNKPPRPPAGLTTVLLSSLNNNNNSNRTVHDKENSTDSREHDRILEGFEDSGYLSLHNSQNEGHHVDEEDGHIQGSPTENLLLSSAAAQQKTISPKQSPTKCQGRMSHSRPLSVVAASTPVDRPRKERRKTAAHSLSSSPTDRHDDHDDHNLPLLKFQRAVCEELAKCYQKNKRYDWSIVTKVAEDHLLDRVIGSHMGLEYVDMFSSLMSRNMKSILTNILVLLGDMDLISCKKVSKTWMKIVCEDTAALSRCRRAEQAFRESRSSWRQSGYLTRDVAVSRVVLSCIQTLSSSSTQSSSSSLGCRVNRRAGVSHKGSTPNSQCTRFNEYVQAASRLKQHESLRPCKRCGSPAIHSTESQRAKCTRMSCLFDFCTCCQEAFHGSTPCRMVPPRSLFPTSRTTPIIPGSKRNIKRL